MEGLKTIFREALPKTVASLLVYALIAIFTYVYTNIGLIRSGLLGLFLFSLTLLWLSRQKFASPAIDDHEIAHATERLSNKLDTLHDLQNFPFCLVGGVYLDILVGPIYTTKLARDEWSSIDEITYDAGGSALWVGRFLSDRHQQSYLFSAIGDEQEPYTQQFCEILRQEKWLLNDFPVESVRPGAKIAVTIHLIQSDQKFGTMFTYRGALTSFGWNDIINKLNDKLNNGGVLYIAGYLKTNLCVGLSKNLGELPENTLKCIDHGRLVRNMEYGTAIEALRNAFNMRQVDLYFCTYDEIFDLYNVGWQRRFLSSWNQVERMLQSIANKECLPLITIVRGGTIKGKSKVFAIVGKSIFPVEGKIGPTFIRNTVGPSNAFNASMLYYLVKERRHQKLEDQVCHAANMAINEWLQWTKNS